MDSVFGSHPEGTGDIDYISANRVQHELFIRYVNGLESDVQRINLILVFPTFRGYTFNIQNSQQLLYKTAMVIAAI